MQDISNYERLFETYDISKALNVSKHVAWVFLKRYGKQVGVKNVITQNEFRRLQMDGTVAKFVKEAHPGRKKEGCAV